MYMACNKDGGFKHMVFTTPIVIFKEVAGHYYPGNILAKKLMDFADTKRVNAIQLDTLIDIGYNVEIVK